MFIINTNTNEYPIEETQLRADFPDLPIPLTAEDLPSGYEEVLPFPPPMSNNFQNCEELAPVRNGAGKFQQQWRVWDMTPEEAEAKTTDMWEKIKAFIAEGLSNSEHTQDLNNNLTPEKRKEWAEYRTRLANIVNQPDPFALSLPVPPAP